MREIKAPRAWLKEHEEMVSVLAINWDTHGNMTLVDIVAPYPGGDPDERVIVGEPPSKLELMWPTGLHDKNGTEGYHKDVTQDSDGDKYLVERDEAGWFLKGIGLNCLGTATDDLEVKALKEQEIIGNEHQNPDLLETKSP